MHFESRVFESLYKHTLVGVSHTDPTYRITNTTHYYKLRITYTLSHNIIDSSLLYNNYYAIIIAYTFY